MKSNFRTFCFLTIFTTLFITACATKLDVVSPAGTDLTGKWLINESLTQPVIFASGRDNQNDSMGGAGMGGGRKRGGMGGPEGSKQNTAGGRANQRLTPAMKSKQMTIEQNHDSMGIAYPNEMYRDIDWGKNEFYRETVTAGWQDNLLIVKSVGERTTLTETYELNPEQTVLTLTISIKSQRGTNEFIRVFNLQS